jgi:hypothetical protein
MMGGMVNRTLLAPYAAIADVVPERGDRAQLVREQARAALLVRLHNRSDDFAATNELQAISALSGRFKSQLRPLQRDRLVHAGLSSVERTRIWLRSKAGSGGRRAEAAVRA